MSQQKCSTIKGNEYYVGQVVTNTAAGHEISKSIFGFSYFAILCNGIEFGMGVSTGRKGYTRLVRQLDSEKDTCTKFIRHVFFPIYLRFVAH